MMTNREFFNAVIAETENTAIAEFAVNALQKMDERNAKRAEKPSKKSIENAPLIESIKAILTEEPKVASAIAAEVEISTQKASALLRQIVANGDAKVCEVKVPKKGTQKGYFIG